VEQHDSRTISADADMDGCAIRLDLFGVETWWEWNDLRERWRYQEGRDYCRN